MVSVCSECLRTALATGPPSQQTSIDLQSVINPSMTQPENCPRTITNLGPFLTAEPLPSFLCVCVFSFQVVSLSDGIVRQSMKGDPQMSQNAVSAPRSCFSGQVCQTSRHVEGCPLLSTNMSECLVSSISSTTSQCALPEATHRDRNSTAPSQCPLQYSG